MEFTTNIVTKRVLVATDDAALPELLSALLAPKGFEVHRVRPDEAEKVYRDGYTILMLDGDPQTNFAAGLPAIVVIAPSDPVAAYDRGADIVVNKPWVANILLAKIKAILRRYDVII